MQARSHPEGIAAASPELRAGFDRLVDNLARFGRLLVAYSGGVDSTLVLKAAVLTLGSERVLGVLADSESLPRREKEQAVALAAAMGASLRVVPTRELTNPLYASNPSNRCYFCKSELYDRLRQLAELEAFDAIADGTNRDDLGEVRPGREAARERGVVSPLLASDLGKDDVRQLSRLLGLPTWDKPASPCLASRIPYGEPVDAAKLARVEAAEEALHACGIHGGRVRYHGDVARVELPEEALGLLAKPEFRAHLARGVRAAGFRYVAVDLEAYRRGRLQETVPETPGAGGANPQSTDART